MRKTIPLDDLHDLFLDGINSLSLNIRKDIHTLVTARQ